MKSTGRSAATWSSFYYSAGAWLSTYELLVDNPDAAPFSAFCVEGPMLALSLELSAKALAAHLDPAFDAMKFRCRITDIIEQYRNHETVFEVIASDGKWMAIIRVYQNWVAVKCGGHYMQIDRPEYERLVDAAYLVFNKVDSRIQGSRFKHRREIAGQDNLGLAGSDLE